jgi:hypothetical protein
MEFGAFSVGIVFKAIPFGCKIRILTNSKDMAEAFGE